MTDPTPTRDEAVRELLQSNLIAPGLYATSTVFARGRAAMAAEALKLLASAPAPASGGVDAVREALLGYVLKPGQYETASAFARGQNRVAVDMLGALDEASLSPAATPVSEAGCFDAAMQAVLCGGRANRRDWNRPSHIERRTIDGLSNPTIVMVMKDGAVGPYTPSGCDMVASDWSTHRD